VNSFSSSETAAFVCKSTMRPIKANSQAADIERLARLRKALLLWDHFRLYKRKWSYQNLIFTIHRFEMTLPSTLRQVKSITSNSIKRIFVTGPVNECCFIVDLFVDILKDKRNMYLWAFHLPLLKRKTPLLKPFMRFHVLSLWIKPQCATNKF